MKVGFMLILKLPKWLVSKIRFYLVAAFAFSVSKYYVIPHYSIQLSIPFCEIKFVLQGE